MREDGVDSRLSSASPRPYSASPAAVWGNRSSPCRASPAAHVELSARPFSADTWSRPGTAMSTRSIDSAVIPNNFIIRPDSRPGSGVVRKIVNRTRKSANDQKPSDANEGNIQDGADDVSKELANHRTDDIMEENMEFSTDDKDWDTDLENEEPKETYDHSGRASYIEACKRSNVVPASFYLRHMNEPKLRMKHHGLGPVGIKPICVSMVGNTAVLHVNLSDNWLGAAGGTHVCEMLKENCYLTSINLSDNRLGLSFVEQLPEVFTMNVTLTRIVLSGNDLSDTSARALAETIVICHHLQKLVLSHNSFGVGAGIAFGPAIAENTSIRDLDLSWNNIRRKGATELAKGIKNNVCLHKVNLSWNGFGLDGAKAVADMLKNNSVLEHLEISNNRITAEGSVLIGKALTVNESLLTLMMGQNPMQTAGCYAICAALLKNPNSKLQLVDFSDILVNSDYRDISQVVLEQFPGLKLKTGGDGVPKKPKAKLHPMVKLRNFISKHNLRLQDVFAQWDKDNSMSVTHDEFREGITDLGLKLTSEEMQTILDELDQDGDGEINYCELVIGHQDFAKKEQKINDVINTMKLLTRD